MQERYDVSIKRPWHFLYIIRANSLKQALSRLGFTAEPTGESIDEEDGDCIVHAKGADGNEWRIIMRDRQPCDICKTRHSMPFRPRCTECEMYKFDEDAERETGNP